MDGHSFCVCVSVKRNKVRNKGTKREFQKEKTGGRNATNNLKTERTPKIMIDRF